MVTWSSKHLLIINDRLCSCSILNKRRDSCTWSECKIRCPLFRENAGRYVFLYLFSREPSSKHLPINIDILRQSCTFPRVYSLEPSMLRLISFGLIAPSLSAQRRSFDTISYFIYHMEGNVLYFDDSRREANDTGWGAENHHSYEILIIRESSATFLESGQRPTSLKLYFVSRSC